MVAGILPMDRSLGTYPCAGHMWFGMPSVKTMRAGMFPVRLSLTSWKSPMPE